MLVGTKNLVVILRKIQMLALCVCAYGHNNMSMNCVLFVYTIEM